MSTLFTYTLVKQLWVAFSQKNINAYDFIIQFRDNFFLEGQKIQIYPKFYQRLSVSVNSESYTLEAKLSAGNSDVEILEQKRQMM